MTNRRLAHLLGRVALGLNIALHGLLRLPHLAEFSQGLRTKFSGTFLPGDLVVASGYGIVIGEAVIGLLLLSGFWQRSVLVAGLLLMMVLTFGTCVQQDWATAGTQLIYTAFYAVLLATLPDPPTERPPPVAMSE